MNDNLIGAIKKIEDEMLALDTAEALLHLFCCVACAMHGIDRVAPGKRVQYIFDVRRAALGSVALLVGAEKLTAFMDRAERELREHLTARRQ
jgi:hypothetical protein